MLSQSQATPAAARAARRILLSTVAPGTVALLAAVGLAGCQPQTTAFAGANPADPAARVAPMRTSAVIAPYTPLRPTAPSAWGQRDDQRTPRSEPSR
jgi:hypothetical protein